MLEDTGLIDPERIGILGSSYGGYLVLAALSFRPGAFAVGVDLFGISNWVRTLERMPPWWGSRREALLTEIGDPERDRRYLDSISPLNHGSKITRPLMVLQGANDPRVMRSESDEIVAAVKAKGVPIEYLVFEDEGHGFRKKENRLEAYQAILQFLDKYLKPGIGQQSSVWAGPVKRFPSR
jgi:dipeptidyl aminopeptidase/acylaminoacyl peptidase